MLRLVRAGDDIVNPIPLVSVALDSKLHQFCVASPTLWSVVAGAAAPDVGCVSRRWPRDPWRANTSWDGAVLAWLG
jgi:hypothetical protein